MGTTVACKINGAVVEAETVPTTGGDVMTAKSASERAPRGRLSGSALPEIVCDACDGRGTARSRKASPTRRVYRGVCKKCGGKGRLGLDKLV